MEASGATVARGAREQTMYPSVDRDHRTAERDETDLHSTGGNDSSPTIVAPLEPQSLQMPSGSAAINGLSRPPSLPTDTSTRAPRRTAPFMPRISEVETNASQQLSRHTVVRDGDDDESVYLHDETHSALLDFPSRPPARCGHRVEIEDAEEDEESSIASFPRSGNAPQRPILVPPRLRSQHIDDAERSAHSQEDLYERPRPLVLPNGHGDDRPYNDGWESRVANWQTDDRDPIDDASNAGSHATRRTRPLFETPTPTPHRPISPPPFSRRDDDEVDDFDMASERHTRIGDDEFDASSRHDDDIFSDVATASTAATEVDGDGPGGPNGPGGPGNPLVVPPPGGPGGPGGPNPPGGPGGKYGAQMNQLQNEEAELNRLMQFQQKIQRMKEVQQMLQALMQLRNTIWRAIVDISRG